MFSDPNVDQCKSSLKFLSEGGRMCGSCKFQHSLEVPPCQRRRETHATPCRGAGNSAVSASGTGCGCCHG
eukprot:3380690-Pyramimonas_sp.AAC.1